MTHSLFLSFMLSPSSPLTLTPPNAVGVVDDDDDDDDDIKVFTVLMSMLLDKVVDRDDDKDDEDGDSEAVVPLDLRSSVITVAINAESKASPAPVCGVHSIYVKLSSLQQLWLNIPSFV
jgi:sirohydrochlorin ferrochelatase